MPRNSSCTNILQKNLQAKKPTTIWVLQLHAQNRIFQLQQREVMKENEKQIEPP